MQDERLIVSESPEFMAEGLAQGMLPLPLSILIGAGIRASDVDSGWLLRAYRVAVHCNVLDDGHGRFHLLWTGPVRPGTAIPMVHRWNGHKNVSAHRALWEIQRGSPPHGNPRRLAECPYDSEPYVCVSPDCFTVATPMERTSLPDYLATSQRTDALGRPLHNYKVRAGALEGAAMQDRYYWRGEDFVKCPGCGESLPTCPEKHLIMADWAREWGNHFGKQYRCGQCTRLVTAAVKLRGSRPRSKYRHASPTNNNRDVEIRAFLDSMPHENTREEAIEEMHSRQHDQLDDDGYMCSHIEQIRNGTMTEADWAVHGDEE